MAAQCVTLAPLAKSFPVGGADPAPEPLCRCSVQPVGRCRSPALRDRGVHIYIYIYVCVFVCMYIYLVEKDGLLQL